MKRTYWKYLMSVFLFGANGLVASQINLNSYEIVLMRTFFGSLLLFMIYLLQKGDFKFLKQKKQVLFLVVSGIALGASWMFLFEAYSEIGVGVASLAYYCGPVIVMILSPFLFREKLTGSKILGFLTVLCGIFFVSGQALQKGNMGWGFFCGGMSAVLYAVMVIFNKKTESITGLENSFMQLFIGLLIVSMFIIVKQGLVFQVATEDWLPILVLGLINTGVGCYLYFSTIGHLPVHTVAICGYLEPLVAVLLSVIVLGEAMKPLQIVGTVLVLGGAMFGELYKPAKKVADQAWQP